MTTTTPAPRTTPSRGKHAFQEIKLVCQEMQ